MATAYMAAVAASPDVVPGEFCQVWVFAEDPSGPVAQSSPGSVVLAGVELAVRADDPGRLGTAGKAAAEVLARHGWLVCGSWWASDNALFAEVVPAGAGLHAGRQPRPPER